MRSGKEWMRAVGYEPEYCFLMNSSPSCVELVGEGREREREGGRGRGRRREGEGGREMETG